eukprot:scaffold227774_cov53-Attheya_sp.AAC.1
MSWLSFQFEVPSDIRHLISPAALRVRGRAMSLLCLMSRAVRCLLSRATLRVKCLVEMFMIAATLVNSSISRLRIQQYAHLERISYRTHFTQISKYPCYPT